ncbi:hypothetical protein Bca101_022053 [Brassica carinata]
MPEFLDVSGVASSDDLHQAYNFSYMKRKSDGRSKCSLLPSTDLHKVGLLPLPHSEQKSLNLHKKVSCTTADGTKPKPQCWDVSYNEMLTRRRLMTPENRLSIQSL